MKRSRLVLLFVAACTASAAAGFWLGFRDGWSLGIAADFLPRGVIATGHLRAIRSGNTTNTITILEFDVDNGLILGHDALNHPLRNLWDPIWGIQISPNLEDYATRLANFRKEHPSLMRPDAFDEVPQDRPDLREVYADLAKGTRENIAKRDFMIQRYATK